MKFEFNKNTKVQLSSTLCKKAIANSSKNMKYESDYAFFLHLKKILRNLSRESKKKIENNSFSPQDLLKSENENYS